LTANHLLLDVELLSRGFHGEEREAIPTQRPVDDAPGEILRWTCCLFTGMK